MKNSNHQTTSHKGMPPERVHEVEVLSPRADYLAANPEARAVHAACMGEIQATASKATHGLKEAVDKITDKTNDIRLFGLSLIRWEEESLPGGKLTRDLYEQHKAELKDWRGQTLHFTFCMGAILMARQTPGEIPNFSGALKYKQQILMGTGDESCRTEAVNPDRGTVVPPRDTVRQMRDLLDIATWQERWDKFKADEKYWVNGELVEHQRELLAEEFAPVFTLAETMKREMGL